MQATAFAQRALWPGGGCDGGEFGGGGGGYIDGEYSCGGGGEYNGGGEYGGGGGEYGGGGGEYSGAGGDFGTVGWGSFCSAERSGGAAASGRSRTRGFCFAEGRRPPLAGSASSRPHARGTVAGQGGRPYGSGGTRLHRGRFHGASARGPPAARPPRTGAPPRTDAPPPSQPFGRDGAPPTSPAVRHASRGGHPYGNGRHQGHDQHDSVTRDGQPSPRALCQQEEEPEEKAECDYWCLESPYYRSLSLKPGLNGSFPQNDKNFKALRHLPDIYFSKIKKGVKNNRRISHKNYQAGEWGVLSQEIWEKYTSNRQRNETYTRKILLWKQLNEFLEMLFPRYVLYMTGSTLNGFGTEQSDLDMCLLVWEAHITRRVEAMAHLEQLLQGLRRCAIARRAELIPAKVPILKFRDARFNLDVDVNCNNDVAVRNTHLLFCYSMADWRVKPLVVVIKLWAACHNINDAKCMTLSSYSLVLMVIHYLQCGTSPPVLPCLGRLVPDMFSAQRNVLEIDVHERADVPRSANGQCLGELLLGFFSYYSHFQYDRFAISVRLGTTLPIEECRRAPSPKNDDRQWNLLCVEEPFELTNTAYAVFDENTFDRVLSVIQTSYYNLLQSKELDSIFQPIGGAFYHPHNEAQEREGH